MVQLWLHHFDFISMKLTDQLLSDLWLEEMGWNSPDRKSRKFDDSLEEAFWEKAAPHYAETNNLNNDTPLIAKTILDFVGRNHRILEIGPGSGNFTVRLSPFAGEILAVEPSAAMRQALKKNLAAFNVSHVTVIPKKWEEAEGVKADYVVSVNSLYRVRDIRSALEKMIACASRGVIIVRMVQRPFFFEILSKLGIPAEECKDHLLIPLFLAVLGYKADVSYLHYRAKRNFSSLEEAYRLASAEAGEREISESDFYQSIQKYSHEIPSGIRLSQARVTAVITVRKGELP